jgi:WD40 repeat protein
MRSDRLLLTMLTLALALAPAGATELEIRKAFALPVSDVVFGDDGRTLTLANDQGQVRIWNLHSGRQVATESDYRSPGQFQAFSPDARWLARGADDGAVELVQLQGGATERRLGGHTGAVYTVAFSADSRWLASGGDDGTVRVWQVATGRQHELLHNAETPPGPDAQGPAGSPVYDVAFSPDGRWLACAGGDGAVRAWSVETYGEPRVSTGHTEAVLGLSFDRDGRFLASASLDGTTRIWDAQSGVERALLASMRNGDGWLVVTPEGWFDGTDDATRRMGRLQQGSQSATLEQFAAARLHPGLLSDVFNLAVPESEAGIEDLDLRPPRLRIEKLGDGPDGKSVLVRVIAEQDPATSRDPGGEVRDVRLYHEGALIGEWLGTQLTGKRTVIAFDSEVATGGGGARRFSASAVNRHGLQGVAELQLGSGDAVPAPGIARILTIGVGRYSNHSFNLPYAVTGAARFGEGLKAQLESLGTFRGVELSSLINQTATRANILAALQTLAGAAAPGDALFVYFGGHGVARGDSFHLIPHDLAATGARGAVSERQVAQVLASSVSDADVAAILERAPATWITLVLDATDPGQATRAADMNAGPMRSRGLARLSRRAGVNVLAATQGYAAANAAAIDGHGFLVHALIREGFNVVVVDRPPHNGLVDLHEWLYWAVVRVPQMQATAMRDARRNDRELAFIDGQESIRDLDRRDTRTPRLFPALRADRSLPLILARP